MRLSLLTFAALAFTTPALADPCEAIQSRGPVPQEYRPGSFFAGPVVYVGDGDSFCLQHGSGGHETWVEVRIADFYAPELREPGGESARDILEDLIMGHWVECRAGRRNWDRLISVCTLDGRSVGQRMRDAGVAEGGRGRPAVPRRA